MEKTNTRRKNTGKRLKDLRDKTGKSMATVASDLGVTSATISYWESGERTPSDDMKVKIAKYYSADIISIFYAD